MLTQTEAWKLIQYYYDNGRREEDKDSFHKTCQYLIDQYDDMNAVMASGGDYYSDHDYSDAFREYTMAAGHEIPSGYIGLGYIWYYGRLGTTDYQKAYECFMHAVALITGIDFNDLSLSDLNQKIILENEDEYDDLINAVYKVADMYEHGYYVEKSYAAFSALIEYLYDGIRNSGVSDYYMPEVELRMSEIVLHDNENQKDQALEYLYDARSRMIIRLEGDSFFGDYSVMKDIVLKVYDLSEFNPDEMDLYDLWYVMQKPCIVTFFCDSQKYEVSSGQDGQINDRNRIYTSVDEWLQKAKIADKAVSFMIDDCSGFQIKMIA